MGCRFESCWARHSLTLWLDRRFFYSMIYCRTRTEQSCEATKGSTTSRFGKRSTAKSSGMPRRQGFAEGVLLGAPKFFHFLLIFERFYGIIFLDLRRIVVPFFIARFMRAFLFNKRINYEQNTNKCIKFDAK